MAKHLKHHGSLTDEVEEQESGKEELKENEQHRKNNKEQQIRWENSP